LKVPLTGETSTTAEELARVLLVDGLPQGIEAEEGRDQRSAEVAGGGVVDGRAKHRGKAEHGEPHPG
jgi:hypothetical protein